MPKIFLIASAVLLIASAALSFLNKGKLTAKNLELTEAHSQTAAAQSDATKAKAAKVAADKATAEATAKAADLQTQLTASGAQVTDLTGKLDTASKDVTAKETEIADLKAKIAAAPKAPDGTVVSPDAQKVVDLTHQLEELKVVKDGLEGQVKSAQAQTAALSREIQARKTGVSMNGLRGQVLAVDHNWNFVVLNLGDRHGVNSNSQMIIQRGGSLVGRVKITSVEPSQSVADIIPNSVPAGIDVRPGDTVVFAGTDR